MASGVAAAPDPNRDRAGEAGKLSTAAAFSGCKAQLRFRLEEGLARSHFVAALASAAGDGAQFGPAPSGLGVHRLVWSSDTSSSPPRVGLPPDGKTPPPWSGVRRRCIFDHYGHPEVWQTVGTQIERTGKPGGR